MNGITRLLTSSVGKKFLMAITGAILSLFVLGHMCGNLQFFLDAKWLNSYAHHLQHLPYGLLWVVRLVMLTAVVVHVVAGIKLTTHNMKARPGYEVDATIQASIGSRTMIWTGLVLFMFIVFHIMHYTVKNVQDFSALTYNLEGYGIVPDVQAIMYEGFSIWYYSLFYIVAVGLLLFHLSHGVASVFQTVGMRNEVWRKRLECIAWVYAAAVFCGFASIPVCVLLDKYVFPNLLSFR
ncbi:MAG: succinate dehydrogenase cytochrome b subunit [Opitutales bacterium]|nr:succinate dehydrogenase cytochrome b subunit [Opitutales bacterium]